MNSLSVYFIFLLISSLNVKAYAQAPTTSAVNEEYEVDYEEEPEETQEVEVQPEKTKGKKKSNASSNSSIQGTHSKNKFAPILESKTKSLYKKNGKQLDVDTD